MKHLAFTFLLSFFLFTIHSFGQNLNHEIGLSVGATSMQTDYKERANDFVGSYRNVGFVVGASYYLSFSPSAVRWNDRTVFLKNHFRLKLDANYIQNTFAHRGRSIYANSNLVDAAKMAAMEGSTKIYNFGGHIEYLIFDSYYDRKFEPYLVGGLYYTIYDPEVESKLGDWKDNPTLLPEEYLNGGIHLDQAITQSFAFGAGSRYNVGNLTLFFELKAQRFMSDEVEGLNPQTGDNKTKDWLSSAQFGVIFKIH